MTGCAAKHQVVHFRVLPSPVFVSLRPTCISPTSQQLNPITNTPATTNHPVCPPLCLSERPFSSCFSFPSFSYHLPSSKGRYRTERHPRGCLCRHTLARLSSLRLHRNLHATVSLDLTAHPCQLIQPAPTTETDIAVVASVDVHRVVSHSSSVYSFSHTATTTRRGLLSIALALALVLS